MSGGSAALKPLAIVTGATRGLGFAIATKLLDEGFEVVGIGRSVPSPTPPFALHRCDLSHPAAVESLFDSALKGMIGGRPRVVLVNNAGTLGAVGSVRNIRGSGSIAELDASVRLNSTVPMYLCGALLAAAPASTIVRIVNISSGAADSPYPGWSTYCSTKCALRMFGRVLAAELAEYPELSGRDIRVLDYAPGVVDTDMQRSVRNSDKANFPKVEKFVDLHKEGKLVKPEDSAEPVVEFALDGPGEAYVQRRYGS